MTGITRKKAAEVAAAYFGTAIKYEGGTYDKYTAMIGILVAEYLSAAVLSRVRVLTFH